MCKIEGRTILITGGAGFVGSHIADAVTGDNDVIVADNLSAGQVTNVPDAATLRHTDITQPGVLAKLTTDIDIVFHQAAVVKEDHVLLIKRTRPPGVGTWSVPAGYLEVDEPPQVAAIRELNQETNVSASRTDLSLLDTQFVTHPDGTTVIVIVYDVSYSNTSGTITSGDDAAAATFFSQTAIESDEVTIESGYQSIALKAIDKFE